MKRVYAQLLVEVSFIDEEPEPLTDAEIQDLASSTSNWNDWNLLSIVEVHRRDVEVKRRD